eukprot:TRINITY_DN10824_c2_g1_i1.p1 TRINITY_DN10824_c2_g1~~TRINITY_DN10824_c2_g1_i1.p1  ORF type:complete len:443 (+),score=72.96 TRINITY_DN10824_c2_g1_i1:90-1418(+)
MGNLCSLCNEESEMETNFISGGNTEGLSTGLQAAATAGVALLVFGGKRPRFRFNNPKIKNFKPQSIPAAIYPGAGRRGVLIGINYFNTKAELSGCINDVKRMAQRLHGVYQLLVLTDDSKDPNRMPTRDNIMRGLVWLARGMEPGGKQTAFLHFSGHGSQQRDKSGEEIDGLDETICPVDYSTAGMITDDNLKSVLLTKIPTGNRLLAVMDCCHSGTVLDLPYYCLPQGNPHNYVMMGDQMSERNRVNCDVLMISGCADSQTSADVRVVGEQFIELQSDRSAGGALTSAILITFSQNPRQNLKMLLQSLRTTLASKGFKQVPQISSSLPYDTRTTVYDLFPESFAENSVISQRGAPRHSVGSVQHTPYSPTHSPQMYSQSPRSTRPTSHYYSSQRGNYSSPYGRPAVVSPASMRSAYSASTLPVESVGTIGTQPGSPTIHRF